MRERTKFNRLAELSADQKKKEPKSGDEEEGDKADDEGKEGEEDVEKEKKKKDDSEAGEDGEGKDKVSLILHFDHFCKSLKQNKTTTAMCCYYSQIHFSSGIFVKIRGLD